ncbi:MAG TPA: DUF4262 domain-containing protein, partial [Pseudonocardiaceae bacterium]|nr:DUF4262 domain-containing protein [Pseudonocardiaceae bacterium]
MAIQGVECDRDHPPWAYTVGLTEYGVPELVATGLRLPRAAELLNGVAAHSLHATADVRLEHPGAAGRVTDDRGHWRGTAAFGAGAVASRCSGRGLHRECASGADRRGARARDVKTGPATVPGRPATGYETTRGGCVRVVTTSLNQRIADELGVPERQVGAAVGLLDGGATVPFVARYRKEATGGLDDAQLRTLEERLGYLRELEERRAAVLNSIREQGKLNEALEAQI